MGTTPALLNTWCTQLIKLLVKEHLSKTQVRENCLDFGFCHIQSNIDLLMLSSDYSASLGHYFSCCHCNSLTLYVNDYFKLVGKEFETNGTVLCAMHKTQYMQLGWNAVEHFHIVLQSESKYPAVKLSLIIAGKYNKSVRTLAALYHRTTPKQTNEHI